MEMGLGGARPLILSDGDRGLFGHLFQAQCCLVLASLLLNVMSCEPLITMMDGLGMILEICHPILGGQLSPSGWTCCLEVRVVIPCLVRGERTWAQAVAV